MSMNLQRERTHQAELAERLATALLTRDLDPWAREQAMAELRAALRQVAVLDQQEAWHGRASCWCWPTMPAWTD